MKDAELHAFHLWAAEHGWELDNSPDTELLDENYWWHSGSCLRLSEEALMDRWSVATSETSESCEGCKHRYWVQPAPLGQTMSQSGWGCSLTGGHVRSRK